ncbi:hypothetical protein F8154_00985 [Alkaliphilus pronyensis]|uniref:PKD domain-containing protein n=1 Tax=Alkaliphilus pronyensis TaxID=1482732 RepID=A0A6I0FJV1_9FIRM|nr:hypothetical protein [Alkaliphilus pronyensis]KAB3539039.1 hypothetical protein F8154_00985 [Alkaliphilus pronyensis]
MENINLTNYNIVDTFKETEKQKIYIGNSLEIDKKMVIINAINDRSIMDEIKAIEESFLLSTLNNLVDIKKEEDKIILITTLNDATPLEAYVEDNTLSLKERMDLVLEYLKHIVKYDQLSNTLKSMLVDEAQVVVEKNGRLAFDEVLIIDSEENTLDFGSIARKIGTVFYKILFYDGIETNNPMITEELNRFIDDLQHNNQAFNSIEGLMEEYRKHYIYYICMNNINKEEDNELPKKKPFSGFEYGGKPKTSKTKNAVIVSFILILMIIGIALGMRHLTPVETLQQPSEEETNIAKPIAEFTVEKDGPHWRFISNSTPSKNNTIDEYTWEIRKNGILLKALKDKDLKLDFKESGIYEVSLQVRDSNNEWSDKFSKHVEITLEDSEENAEGNISSKNLYTINYKEDEITIDTSIFRKDSFSYRIDNNTTSAVLALEDIEIESGGFLTFWILGTKDDKVNIDIQLFDKNQKLTGADSITHKLQSHNNWEMVTLQVAQASKVRIVLSQFSNTLWIDDIQLELLK